MKKSLIIFGSIVAVLGLLYLGLIYTMGRSLGGGAQEVHAPDTVRAGDAATVQLIASATGGGGPIEGRFTNLSLHYRLAGEIPYNTVAPQPAVLPDNFKAVQSDSFQSEAYTFTIPPYPQGTTGEIEYYTEMTFDGFPSKTEGRKTIRVSE